MLKIIFAACFKYTSKMISGPPLPVEINMQVRSMGPISEIDMVGKLHIFFLHYLSSPLSLWPLYDGGLTGLFSLTCEH